MNLGLTIFKKRQRFQGGTNEVRDKIPPFFENGKWWWEREDAGKEPKLRPMSEMPENEEDLSPEELRREQEDYKRRVRESKYIQAQQGTSNVQHLQEGVNNLGYDPADPRNDLTRGFGSGRPTQRGFGFGANILGNLIFPGLGTLTGPLASWAVRALQSGMSRDAVQKAVQDYQQQQPTSGTTDTGDGNEPPMPQGSVDLPTGKPDTTAGVGIDPFGNPAKPGEWWSPDFGRWNETDKYGTTPGNYVGPGPGLPQGRLGTGFGSGTVGNFATAIGFDRLGAGGGSTNLSAMGGGPAASQTRQIMKGIYTPMTGYGYGPLSGFTGTQAPSAATNIAAQQQLHDILMANPGALSGPVSGNITRGVPMKQGVQRGSSNITNNTGLQLFKSKMKLHKLTKPKI